MDETLEPTMSFRWLVPSLHAYAEQPSCGRLQQMFWRGNKQVWKDVPVVEDYERQLAEQQRAIGGL